MMKLSMSLKMRKNLILILGICLILPTAIAGTDYVISRYVISSGGGSSTGSSYLVRGTIGQPVTEKSSGSGYSITSGYWYAREVTDLIFKNNFE